MIGFSHFSIHWTPNRPFLSSTPSPQINVDSWMYHSAKLARPCKTGACIKATKICFKNFFSSFSTVQQHPSARSSMTGPNNKDKKQGKKWSTYPWYLILFAQKHVEIMQFCAAIAHGAPGWSLGMSGADALIAPASDPRDCKTL